MGDRLGYRAHDDLLDQVAASDLERADVRRVLGAPLTEQDLDALQKWRAAPFAAGRNTHAHRYSACKSGPCQGGTKLCPSPEACQCAERDDRVVRVAAGVVLAVTATLTAAAIVVTLLIAAGYA